MQHRVLLVREWDAQTAASGCCGRLGGEHTELGDAETYRHVRADMEAMGAVYRALRTELPADVVDLTVVDPRNMVWLVPAIWRDARRRGLTRTAAWREVRRGVAQRAIVVDGRTVSSRVIPAPEEAVDLVMAELAAASSA